MSTPDPVVASGRDGGHGHGDGPGHGLGRPALTRREMRSLVVAAMAYATAIVLVVWVSLRPVWGAGRFDTVVAVALVVGLAAACLGLVTRRLWLGLLALFGGYAAAGATLAIDGALTRTTTAGLLATARDLVVGPVTGWKDVVTLPTPLGEFGATLIPPLALVAGGTFAIVWVGSAARRWGIAAGVAGAMVVVAISAGPATRAPLFALPEPFATWGAQGIGRSAVIGLVALGATVAWLRVRTGLTRRWAVRAHPTRRLHARRAGRGLAAIALGVAAIVSALAIGIPVSAAQEREVARTQVEPRLVIASAITPLAGYRTAFTDEHFNAELFRVEVLAGAPTRLRVATLPYFDGRTFSATAPEGFSPLRFQRFPAAVAVDAPATVRVTIDGLGGPWVPLPGALGDVDFGGPRAGALADGFFYAPDAAAAVVTADGGVAAGDVLTVTGGLGASGDSAASAVARASGGGGALAAVGDSPGRASVAPDLIPESLRDWVEAQEVTRDGAGLATLVDRLRARGYLSHALDATQASAWTSALGDYDFQPAAAGHSFDRIDAMFTALLAREAATASRVDAALVAAVGDDEQFAAAVALLAAELGFPSRVVMGVRLDQTVARGWVPAPCDQGVCRGGNLSAWTEVLTAAGEWVAVDVTPQAAVAPARDTADQRDPELPTATDPRRAESVDAAGALKGRSAGESPEVTSPTVEGWPGWARWTAVGGVAVLLALAPLVVIAVAKAVRRRRRRTGTPRERAQGGWEEYLDVAQDSHHEHPPRATRTELARAYHTTHGGEMAALADRATFTAEGVTAAQAAQVWEWVAADRVELLERVPRWRRLGSRLSTRSLRGRRGSRTGSADPLRWRSVAAAPGRSAT